MQIDLSGRTALVTGASMGLGFAMADAFYQAGAKVGILARRADPLEQARARIAQGNVAGAAIAAYECDVTDPDQILETHARLAAALGPVDILVNNAGQSAAMPFTTVTDVAWQNDLDLKLFAAIRFTRLVWPHMQASRWGRIINVLNTAAKAPPANSAPTSVTRAAGMALTKVLSAEGAPDNVLVNAMLIGSIKSDQIRRMHEASDGDGSLEEFMTAAGAGLPMGRMGEAEECANLALFLASDASSYITGCAINMDGGLSKVV
ncbi:MAG: SDR family oxidoreductase [Gammaproteobacteria bacterium]|nr:SDR family oxidoreductase [Gammaproteobacteria bacterium]